MAFEDLKTALRGKTRGFRGPHNSRQMAEVVAGDVVAACDLVPQAERDQVVLDLRKGSAAGQPNRPVVIYADDLFHLVEKAEQG